MRRLVLFLALCTAAASGAEPLLYTHDDLGRLATVDVETGEVAIIGTMSSIMTDIAFAPDGRLFAMDFGDIYQVDPLTAQTTFIGEHPIPNGNALVFGGDDVLYATGGSSTQLWQVDPANGSSIPLGDIGASSAGDLAFHGGELYVSSIDGNLVRIDLDPVSGTVVGSLGFDDVFGLATADDGVLYGISGTQVFSVDTTTGGGTALVDYAGQGLGVAFGSSFVGEALPTCPAVPFENCLVAGKAKLKVVEKKRGNEKLSLSLKGVTDATTQMDFGDPVTGPGFQDICLWRGESQPVVRLTIDRAGGNCGPKQKPCWKAKGDKGWSYSDPYASASGVRKLTFSSGPAGKGKLSVSAGNKEKKGQTALPHGIADRYTGATSAFVQISASDGRCYEAVLGTVQKADGQQVKAKKP
jgi:hypothetical protein